MTKGWEEKTTRTNLIEGMYVFGPFYDATYPQMVRIYNTQSMLYSADDFGPFELSAGEMK